MAPGVGHEVHEVEYDPAAQQTEETRRDAECGKGKKSPAKIKLEMVRYGQVRTGNVPAAGKYPGVELARYLWSDLRDDRENQCCRQRYQASSIKTPRSLTTSRASLA